MNNMEKSVKRFERSNGLDTAQGLWLRLTMIVPWMLPSIVNGENIIHPAVVSWRLYVTVMSQWEYVGSTAYTIVEHVVLMSTYTSTGGRRSNQ